MPGVLGRSEPQGERIREPRLHRPANPGHIAVGPYQDGVTAPSTGRSHVPTYLASVRRTQSAHGAMSRAPWPPEVEQHRSGLVQEFEDAERAGGGDQIKVGHSAAKQRVSLAEVIMNVQARHHGTEALARLLHAKELGHRIAQHRRALVAAAKRHRSHRVTQDASSNRVALGVVGVQKRFRRGSLDRPRQLSSEVYRILPTRLEALPTIWRMHVCGVAGQQNPPLR
jgi:hypothetical protein